MRNTLLISAIVLSGCAISNSNSSTTLSPLPTTGITAVAPNTVQIVDPRTVLTTTTFPVDDWARNEYKNYVWSRDVNNIRYSDDDIMSWAETWCDFMNNGMGKLNIYDWVAEMASDEEEMYAWLVTAEGAAYHICPNNGYKWNP